MANIHALFGIRKRVRLIYGVLVMQLLLNLCLEFVGTGGGAVRRCFSRLFLSLLCNLAAAAAPYSIRIRYE